MPVSVHVIDHPDARVPVDTGMTELHPAVADLDPRLHPLSKQEFDLAGPLHAMLMSREGPFATSRDRTRPDQRRRPAPVCGTARRIVCRRPHAGRLI